MIKLRGRIQPWDAEPFVARIATDTARPRGVRASEALICAHDVEIAPDGFAGYFSHVGSDGLFKALPADLHYLSEGDIVRVVPRVGEIAVLYRRQSGSNAIFTTERCNSNCVMCSQPPRKVDDSHIARAFLEAIPLMAKETKELGITGGEPTLLGDQFIELLRAIKVHLPRTGVHVLSNGRMFNYLSLSRAVASVQLSDLMIGIPLYADVANAHDYVVQAGGAFDQTIRGILNLKRCGVKVEIRVVLHRLTLSRLPQLATFIARNIPMVDHVALMGLEMMGYAKQNAEALRVPFEEQQDALTSATRTVASAGIPKSIYNFPLCTLQQPLRTFAKVSISDWKREYLDCCEGCTLRADCGGLFTSTTKYLEHGISKYASKIRKTTGDDLQSANRFS